MRTFMLNAYTKGDHICALYEDEDEQLAIAAAYIADGLASGERCLYVAGSPAALQRFRLVLGQAGIDPSAMAECGALIEMTYGDVYLAGGCFDCERMLTQITQAVAGAHDAGFTGLRACGDMTWLLAQPPGADD